MCGGCCVEYIIAISLCVWGGKLYSTSAISMRVCGGCCVEYISYKPVYVCVWGGGGVVQYIGYKHVCVGGDVACIQYIRAVRVSYRGRKGGYPPPFLVLAITRY